MFLIATIDSWSNNSFKKLSFQLGLKGYRSGETTKQELITWDLCVGIKPYLSGNQGSSQTKIEFPEPTNLHTPNLIMFFTLSIPFQTHDALEALGALSQSALTLYLAANCFTQKQFFLDNIHHPSLEIKVWFSFSNFLKPRPSSSFGLHPMLWMWCWWQQWAWRSCCW